MPKTELKKSRQEFDVYFQGLLVARIKAYSDRQAMAWFCINAGVPPRELSSFIVKNFMKAIMANKIEVAKMCPHCFYLDPTDSAICPNCDEEK